MTSYLSASMLQVWFKLLPCISTYAQVCGEQLLAHIIALSLPICFDVAGLLPAPIFGPLLGILGVFIADKGDMGEVRKKLFPDHDKGQFKSG